MYPSHLGPGDRVDFVEPPADGPILGYSHRNVAARRRQRREDDRPIGERINLYGYVLNNPINLTDPSGLGVTAYQCCKAWCDAEMKKGIGWLNTLPNCPCSVGSPPTNPNPKVWFEPGSEASFHPGSSVCIRSKPATSGGPGQQCCYDGTGALITGGYGAGTPDKVAPAGNILNYVAHFNEDVVPFNQCYAASGVPVLTIYLKCRPPNNGNNCPANVV